jgi:glycosyltransferase involved in cell wall biosynthesis
MDMSVIIPVRNGAATIGDQLSALAEQSLTGTWEVIIADDGSTDATIAVARSFADKLPSLQIVTVEGRGIPAGRNTGVSASTGRLLAFLDDDDRVAAGYLQAMLDASEDADLLAGRLNEIRPLGDPQFIPNDALPILHGFLPFAMGCMLTVTREAFESVGGFDSAFGPTGAEDVDFSWRVQLAGFRAAFVEDALIHYHHRTTLRAALYQRYDWAANDALLMKRHAINGLETRPITKAIRHWAWLVVHLPDLRNRIDRIEWLSELAVVTGRLHGCVRHRYFAP